MKIIARNIREILTRSAEMYPVVSVTGPRQSGKTTLLRDTFKNKPYFNLEDPEKREMIASDPKRFFKKCDETGAVIDEIQRLPELLSYIQVIVDEKKINGYFIISGSQQFNLLENITQSLAGRTAVLKLLPFSYSEISDFEPDTDQLLVNGGYPRLYSEKTDPHFYYQNYVETYIERDLRQLISVRDINAFRTFLKLCAGRAGSILNSESLSNDTGVSANTVRNWISILETSFILFRLPPYFENRGKRLIRSPKLYFYDNGLLCYLLGIENAEQLEKDRMRGPVFENLVITEFVKSFYNRGRNPELYFYRDSNGNEIDLIKMNGRDLEAVEIKSASTYTRDFIKNIKLFSDIYKDRIRSCTVVYNGDDIELESVSFRSIKTLEL